MRFKLNSLTGITLVTVACALFALFTVGLSLSGVELASASSSQFTRPSEWSPYRPAIHITPNRHWMNDPQRPFFIDGVWHFYYLYNADYPNGNGTAWYHMTSKDLVHWQEHGVAIHKYKNGLGDIQTGSVVVDTKNTAGFGAGAIIAIATQQHEGVQRQSLFVSTDGGYHFKEYDDNPIMDNPGAEHWRDPKVIWDEENRQWVMALAEGHKIGIYTSSDLKHWTYQSDFQRDDLGLLECPDLFQLSLDGDPNNIRWVLASGANGFRTGKTTGTAYWIGSWDGKRFIPESEEPQWLDAGADFYAMVSWQDSNLGADQRLESRYAIGWLNNWGYANELPTKAWHGAASSIVRQIKLRTVDGTPVLFSQPIEAIAGLEGDAYTRSAVEVLESSDTSFPKPISDAYRLKVDLDVHSDASEFQLQLKGKDGHFAIVGYDFEHETVFIRRDRDAIASSMPDVYREERKAVVRAHNGIVKLDIIVDTFTIEVFVNDGEMSLSNLIFVTQDANDLTAVSVGGTTVLRNLELTPLKVTPIQRYSGEGAKK
ncbi:glycoside hydrolase family 32 protein [Vibrio natriegens]|uniref:glycoside hydrolase family 32 protein n=1 Tax=Vibrio natriegens TaxID=691 RepID=UPI001EFEA6EF|nr:glycoside hydrolase family 32 protein [Vibrio natriegens]MCG9698738.1 glycoside hydrolase family 32 protein [Vibrio natriegens]